MSSKQRNAEKKRERLEAILADDGKPNPQAIVDGFMEFHGGTGRNLGKCVWSAEDVYDQGYNTACGNQWDADTSDMEFCPFCAGSIERVVDDSARTSKGVTGG